MDIEIEIEGVPDKAIADRIRKKIRRLHRSIDRPGEWRLAIGPSETRGEWDIGILAPASGWQLTSLAAAVDQLPDAVERTLRARLELPMTPPAV